MSKVLLVKSYKGTSWGFPKGKIDKGEDKMSCAVREVLEEIGYDCSALIDENEFLEMQWQQQVEAMGFCTPSRFAADLQQSILACPPSNR